MPTAHLPMAEDPDFTFDGGWVNVAGRSFVAFTDRGRPFKGFVPDVGVAANDRYFCHGYSFGTYANYGYSPFSGPHVTKILMDEYAPVNLDNLARGDVVAWASVNGVIHTCIVTNTTKGTADVNVQVRTKNGRFAEEDSTLAKVHAIYGNATVRSYWRRR